MDHTDHCTPDPLQSQGGNQYRIASSDAPHQYGHNIFRLNPTGGQVSVQLQGQSTLSGADWRFQLVAVRSDYPMWQVGVGDPFPYQLTITGATPS